MAKRRLTRSEQREQTRTTILAVAERVFSERGYHAASVDEIAEAAGYSKGAVYSNFSGKSDLFLAIMDERAIREQAAMTGSGAPPPAAGAGPDGWALATLDFFLVAVHDDEVRRRLAERYAESRARLGAMLIPGTAGPDWASPEEVATIAMAIGSGLIIQTTIDETAVAPDLMGRAMARLLAPAD